MFTAQQITAAHSKVQSGADFPAFIQAIKALGVTHYETYVTDGHIDYHGAGNYTVQLPAKYATLNIAPAAHADAFKEGLLAHQQGKTNFLTFIHMCAGQGIKKWAVCMQAMTCTYYSIDGHAVLVESIPG